MLVAKDDPSRKAASGLSAERAAWLRSVYGDKSGKESNVALMGRDFGQQTVAADQWQHFSFEICGQLPPLVIKAFPLDEECDPDIAVSTKYRQPTKENATWSTANQRGPVGITIDGCDFKPGVFYIGVYGYKPGAFSLVVETGSYVKRWPYCARGLFKSPGIPSHSFRGELKYGLPVCGEGALLDHTTGALLTGTWRAATDAAEPDGVGNGTISYANGDEYVGEWRVVCRHGQGRMTYKEGLPGGPASSNITAYTGPWVNDAPVDGLGMLDYSNGNTFTGLCSGGCDAGLSGSVRYGPAVEPDRDAGGFYVGNLAALSGKRHGEGKMRYGDSGDVYEGDWKDGDRVDGEGLMDYSNGEVYDGQWKDEKRDGVGRMKFANGDICGGHWESGSVHGEGEYHYHHGDVYVGMFNEGVREGKGQMVYASGLCFEGDWKKGDVSGEGVVTLPNGDVHTGSWAGKDKSSDGTSMPVIRLDGPGHVDCKSGLGGNGGGSYTYEGEWSEMGKINGSGKYTMSNGDVYKGLLHHGLFVDQAGEYTFKDGSIYCGAFFNGVFHGAGTMKSLREGDTLPSLVYIGQWEDGLMHGQGEQEVAASCTHCAAAGVKHVGDFRLGVREGPGVTTFPSGDEIHGRWGKNICHLVSIMHSEEQCTYTGDFEPSSIKMDCDPRDWMPFPLPVRTGDGLILYNNPGQGGSGGGGGNGIQRYQGQWVDGTRSGQGEAVYVNKDSYIGDWEGGVPKGNGKMWYLSRGCIYDGAFGDDGLPCGGNGMLRVGEKGSTSESSYVGVYSGETLQGQRHGRGTMRYSGSNFCDMYEGDFEMDQRCGEGRFCTERTAAQPDGTVFTGQWRGDKQDGHGVLKQCSSGIIFTGTWNNGNIDHGKADVKDPSTTAELKYPNKAVFYGTFKQGSIERGDGHGEMHYPNSSIYVGQFKDMTQFGEGVLTSAAGYVYQGQFQSDKVHGQASYTWTHGVYKGQWQAGKRHGSGTLQMHSGERYEGTFDDDVQTGEGKRTFKNGDVLLASWQGGKQKDGRGSMTSSNGDVYDGEFVAEMRHGAGIMSYNTGDKYDGEWARNRKEGQGKLTLANGKGSYEGGFRADRNDGEGVKVYENGDSYDGAWLAGRKEGEGTLTILGSGMVHSGTFVQDKPADPSKWVGQDGLPVTFRGTDGQSDGQSSSVTITVPSPADIKMVPPPKPQLEAVAEETAVQTKQPSYAEAQKEKEALEAAALRRNRAIDLLFAEKDEVCFKISETGERRVGPSTDGPWYKLKRESGVRPDESGVVFVVTSVDVDAGNRVALEGSDWAFENPFKRRTDFNSSTFGQTTSFASK